MINSHKQYLVSMEKLSELRIYLIHVEAFPVKSKIIQKARIDGVKSVIADVDAECLTYLNAGGKSF